MLQIEGFRLRPIPTLIFALFGFLFGALTVWQVSRFVERAEIEDTRDARLELEPVTIESASDLAGPDLDNRRGVVKARLLPHTAFVVEPGSGGRCHVVSPVELADGSIVAVNRGMVPTERRIRCKTDEMSEPQGDSWDVLITVPDEGLVDYRARHEPELDWAAMDVQGMFERWEIEPDSRAVLLLSADNGGDPLPRAGWDSVTNPYLTSFTHLNYAATWFVGFLIVLGFWLATCAGAFDPRDAE